MSLNTLEICHTHSPDACVIWLHGLGADGYDFQPVVEALNLEYVRFILPHAPIIPVTLNNGYEMPAWYDIYTLDRDGLQDESGIRSMQNQIATLIETQCKRGISSQRIVLAGFSQGGAMALHTGLRYAMPLAGIIGLSTYLPLREKLPDERLKENQHIPIFLAHGEADDIIPCSTGKNVVSMLSDLNYSVEWHEYRISHSVCPEEILDIRKFLERALPRLD